MRVASARKAISGKRCVRCGSVQRRLLDSDIAGQSVIKSVRMTGSCGNVEGVTVRPSSRAMVGEKEGEEKILLASKPAHSIG